MANADLWKNAVKVIAAADKALEKSNPAEFICPICGGKAHAAKAPNNGHRSIYCSGCDMTLQE